MYDIPLVLRVTLRGPAARPFAWEILGAEGEVAHANENFHSRDDAQADGERALEAIASLQVRDPDDAP
jgi:hypothetical protein